MTAPLSAAWRWSLDHSPIVLAWRWLKARLRPHARAAALLRETDAAPAVRARIDTIVRRTRLWSSERLDVARELIAHAADATAAGRDEPDILSSLGDPPTVARLIRRSMKRKRSWNYWARAWLQRGVCALLLATIIGYGALAARFYAGSPDVRTDYIALLNARNQGAEPAYPAYEDLRIAWARHEQRLEEHSNVPDDDDTAEPGMNLFPAVPQSHPDYADIAAAVRAVRPGIDRAADATKLPAIARPYSPSGGHEDPDNARFSRFISHPPPPIESDDAWLIAILLPDLGTARRIAQLLVFDTALAARDDDPDRAAANINATLRLSAQAGREPFLISDMVAIAIHELACNTIRDTLRDHPGLFDHAHLVDIAHTLASARTDAVRLGLESETFFFDDFLQRAYTDDGKGDGRLTPKGIELLRQATDSPTDFGFVPEGVSPVLSAVSSPAALALDPGRRVQRERYHDYIARCAEVDAAAPHLLPELELAEQELARTTPRYTDAVDLLAPALSRAVANRMRADASADATAVVLAIAAHKSRTGTLPDALDDLVPAALPAVPADPFDPGQPIKYRAEGDAFTVYFAGADGDDDHARPPANPDPQPRADHAVSDLRVRYPAPPLEDHEFRGRDLIVPFAPRADAPDGDWVVFPSPSPSVDN